MVNTDVIVSESDWPPPPDTLRLEEGVVHVWRTRLRGDPWHVRMARAVLSDDERKRADRFLQDVHGQRFTLCRAALRRLIGRYLDVEPESVAFDYLRHGKPAVRAGRPGLGFEFNVAHSGELALLAFGWRRRIGVDVEARNHEREFLKIAKRFFSPAECACLNEIPERERMQAFYECWTRKEAYLKACGGGLAIALDSFDVVFAPGEEARITRIEDEGEDPAQWRLQSLAPARGYSAALATDAPARLELYEVVEE